MKNLNKNKVDFHNKIVLLGGGGHSRSVIDAMDGKYSIVGFVDEVSTGNILEIPYFGNDDDLKRMTNKSEFLIHICFAGAYTLNKRRDLFHKFKQEGWAFASLISPTALFSKASSLDEGTIIMANAFCGPFTQIGKNVIVNNGVHIEHDCIIDSHCHLAPRSLIAGEVMIGEGCFIGAGTIIKENLKIGEGAIIGAGLVIYGNVPSGAKLISQADMDELRSSSK